MKMNIDPGNRYKVGVGTPHFKRFWNFVLDECRKAGLLDLPCPEGGLPPHIKIGNYPFGQDSVHWTESGSTDIISLEGPDDVLSLPYAEAVQRAVTRYMASLPPDEAERPSYGMRVYW